MSSGFWPGLWACWYVYSSTVYSSTAILQLSASSPPASPTPPDQITNIPAIFCSSFLTSIKHHFWQPKGRALLWVQCSKCIWLKRRKGFLSRKISGGEKNPSHCKARLKGEHYPCSAVGCNSLWLTLGRRGQTQGAGHLRTLLPVKGDPPGPPGSTNASPSLGGEFETGNKNECWLLESRAGTGQSVLLTWKLFCRKLKMPRIAVFG